MTYVDLQSAGIEFPASVVAELEASGVQIDRCKSSGPGGRTVRAVRLPRSAEQVGSRPSGGAERENALPQPMPSADWGEVRVYRGSLWLALEAAWAELTRGRNRALLSAPARSIRPNGHRRARVIVPLAAIAAIAITAAVLTGISGGKAHRHLAARSRPRSETSARAATRPRGQRQTATASSTARASSSRISGAAASPAVTTSSISAASAARSSSGPSTGARSGSSDHGVTTPSGAVQAFYEAAAHHQYGTAWALTDANMRSQLEGYAAFADEMSSVRSITFHRTQMLSRGGANVATVAVQTVSAQRARVQECGGRVRTLRTHAGWVLDGISIACS